MDFILDNVAEVKMKGKQERYPLVVYGDPVVESDVQRVEDYVTVWPCKQEKITIKVTSKPKNGSDNNF